MKINQTVRVAALVAFAATMSPVLLAQAQNAPGRGTEVEPYNALDGVTLNVAVSRLGERGRAAKSAGAEGAPSFRLSEHIEVCFTATADGFVTVWSDDLVDAPAKIYPNRLSGHATRAQAIVAGEQACVGDHEKFRLKLTEPLGRARINVIWTKTLEDQPAEDEYAMTRSGDRRTDAASRSLDTKAYASQSFDYTIIGKGG